MTQQSDTRRSWPPMDLLYEFYINQGIPPRQLGVLFGISPQTVRLALREYGIPRKEPGRSVRVKSAPKNRRKVKWEPGFLSLYRVYRKSAREQGRPFELTEQQFHALITSDCSYCGSPPQVRKRHKGLIWNGIDRIDNEQGYTIENSRPCCQVCNWMKRDMPEHRFIAHVLQIAGHLESSKF